MSRAVAIMRQATNRSWRHRRQNHTRAKEERLAGLLIVRLLKRYARLTAAHTKRLENNVYMVALYTCWYKFARINSAVRMSPAKATRLETPSWDIGDIVTLIEEYEAV